MRKSVIVCVTLIAVIVVILSAVTFVNKSSNFYSRKISIDTSTGMTVLQRSEDFDLLCSQLEDNVPMLYDYEKLYGISYSDIKEYYKSLAENAKNDFEYYTIAAGFLNNIPSRHMSLGFPLISAADEEFRPALAANSSFVNAQNYWFDVIHEECKKYYETDMQPIIFAYYSGSYICVSEDDTNELNRAELLSVNDTPADEFIRLCSTVSKLKYDHADQKPFRDTIIFNDAVGEKCIIEYIDAYGKKHRREVYSGADLVMSYIDYFKQLDGLTEHDAPEVITTEKSDYTVIGDMTITRSEKMNILIIRIDGFVSEASDGEIISNVIKASSKDIDNIIVDLRSNRGGYFEYAKRLLGAVSDRDIEINNSVYITEECYKRSSQNSEYEFDEPTGLYKTETKEIINGEMTKGKNIYLLISDHTASSADMTAYEFKRNGLGLVIGTNNTGGERDGILCLNYTDISGLYYTYTEYSSYNDDGNINSVYGTAPDIYPDANVENYFIRKEIVQSGGDPYTLENMLKWDSVLAETMEIIKEKADDA